MAKMAKNAAARSVPKVALRCEEAPTKGDVEGEAAEPVGAVPLLFPAATAIVEIVWPGPAGLPAVLAAGTAIVETVVWAAPALPAGPVATAVAAVVTPAGAEAGAGVPTTRAAADVVLPATVEKMTWGTVMAVERTDVVEDDGMTVPDEEQGTTMVVRTFIVVTSTEEAGVTVVTEAAQVMMAGLELMWGAQIPCIYDCADAISSSVAPWADKQS